MNENRTSSRELDGMEMVNGGIDSLLLGSFSIGPNPGHVTQERLQMALEGLGVLKLIHSFCELGFKLLLDGIDRCGKGREIHKGNGNVL